MYVLYTYLFYLVLSIAVTIWVARTLHKNGRAFLVDAFHGQEALADSVNHLLVVGFYLDQPRLDRHDAPHAASRPETLRAAIELLSDKVGTVLFVLGLMHFFNLFLFSRFRRRALDRLATAPPPIPPTGFVTPAERGAMTRLTVFYDARCGLCCARP